MTAPSMKTLLGAAAILGLGIASTLVAQTLSDSPQRAEHKRADLPPAC